MNDRKLQRKLQQLQLRSGRDVEITSSFHGSVIHLRNQPSAIYGAYRGPFSVILTGAENNLPPEILITDLSYNGNVRRAGEVKLFNARVIRVPETRLPLNDCDVYLHIYYDTGIKTLIAEFYTTPPDTDVPDNPDEEWILLAKVICSDGGAIIQMWKDGNVNINYRWW